MGCHDADIPPSIAQPRVPRTDHPFNPSHLPSFVTRGDLPPSAQPRQRRLPRLEPPPLASIYLIDLTLFASSEDFLEMRGDDGGEKKKERNTDSLMALTDYYLG